VIKEAILQKRKEKFDIRPITPFPLMGPQDNALKKRLQ